MVQVLLFFMVSLEVHRTLRLKALRSELRGVWGRGVSNKIAITMYITL